ncbi:possible Pollen allergen [Prochlorococcus marinus str. MIT 9515]|uniref:Possible Pollen allergen n=1 Tax=Prochlorococcus marinus (strain MIT 9515) TaxID=167542 RepID=A2BUU1_PROM5|nr:hypothetical protein [Prochlorococcus marinus]ABM71552.1 possible Pollen allergen [Prochlorococcus marinus str. MIT 9515]
MTQIKTKLSSIVSQNTLALILSIIVVFSISIKQTYALSHEWVGVPISEYGEQLWDRKSIKRNEDGSVRVLSKFIPKTKSEITQDILYTMDINCFEKSFRDVDVFTDEANSRLNNLADWKDPNGDQLILGVIGQVCRVEN